MQQPRILARFRLSELGVGLPAAAAQTRSKRTVAARDEAGRLIPGDFPHCKSVGLAENRTSRGVLAQLVERLNGIEEVRGSNPLGSTFVGTLEFKEVERSAGHKIPLMLEKRACPVLQPYIGRGSDESVWQRTPQPHSLFLHSIRPCSYLQAATIELSIFTR